MIQKILNAYYPNPEIPLHYKNPYTLLIATVLSAQTTDLIVNKVTEDLFLLADCPEKMIAFSQEEITSLIKSCGLSNQKAKALLHLSYDLLINHEGLVPDNFEDLEKLPGVGHKTASVVMAFAFNKEAFPVDRHIMRCAKRWGLSKGSSPNEIEKDFKKTFPKNEWKKIHLQMILFGRNFCKANEKTPCPICKLMMN